LETLRVVLSADRAAFSWEPGDSDYLWGYVVSGARSLQGPFTALATTTGRSFDLALDEDFEYRWLRVDPVSITGTASVSDQPIPVAHRVAREASARNAHAEVLDAGKRGGVRGHGRVIRAFETDDGLHQMALSIIDLDKREYSTLTRYLRGHVESDENGSS
jgi:hypothetical protein